MIKQALDERIKHRLIGIMVVVSLIVIFLPALIKHSNHRFDDKSNLSFRLPKKPMPPKVVIIDKNSMFQSSKIATVNIPPMTPVHTQISKAVPLSIPKIDLLPKINLVQIAPDTQVSNTRPGDFFAIQLATFAQEANAQALVSSLRNKGFQAASHVIKSQQGSELYQVIVGQLKQREQAIDLQKKLVSNTQLNGLIIRTKVS